MNEKFFEPEGVFGRHTKLDSTYGRVNQWLVFWKGCVHHCKDLSYADHSLIWARYKWSDATWEPAPPSEEAVKVFTERAAKEGLDLDDDNLTCIMLAEAEEGGAKNPDA